MRFAYKKEVVNGRTIDMVLQRAGMEGWELVSAVNIHALSPGDILLIFKKME